MKNLIFDFDGVIGDTFEANLSARIGAGKHPNRESALKEMTEYFDRKPHHTRDTVLSEEKLKEIKKWVTDHGEHISKVGFELFELFVAEVLLLKNVRMAIVSSGSMNYIKEPLSKTKLAFTHILTFEDHHSKEEKIEWICKDWGVTTKDVYYFTDSVADVYELENFIEKNKLIGCAWGYSGYEKLSALLPKELILKNWDDIHRLFPNN